MTARPEPQLDQVANDDVAQDHVGLRVGDLLDGGHTVNRFYTIQHALSFAVMHREIP